jgi:hypothetical protein
MSIAVYGFCCLPVGLIKYNSNKNNIPREMMMMMMMLTTDF